MADRIVDVLLGILQPVLRSEAGGKQRILKDKLVSSGSNYKLDHENYSFTRAPSRAATVLTTDSECYAPIPISSLLNPFSDYLSEDAKVWTTYLELTKSKGEELMRIWNSDLDTILIFAGLFSAILTAFLIETRKGLQRDNQDTTNILLELVIETLQSPQTASQEVTVSQNSHYTPPAAILWINGLLFVSLTFSLVGAFGTILAKGWVSQFIPVSAGLPMDDACNRHRRFFGDDQRHLRTVITTLPITLHIAFYLFFGGLVTLLFQDDPRIAVVVTALIAATMLLYLGCSMRPILNPQSPFRTPLSSLLPIFPALLLPLVVILDICGHVYYKPMHRRFSKRRMTREEITKMELLCLSVTQLRKQWSKSIFRAVSSVLRLVLVSRPPSDELRTEVLVNLFFLSRGSHLEGPICALAGLPITARLQRLLYDIDPFPTLTRSLSDVLSGVGKSEGSDSAEAHLIVFLSLVQTTNSALNWTANSLIPVLEPGGVLHSWVGYSDNIVLLMICIRIHIHVRSGLSLSSSFTDPLPNMLLNCTKPLYRKYLIEALLALSAIDGGQMVTKLVADATLRQMVLEVDFGTILSNMMHNPQRRIHKGALNAIRALSSNPASCYALVRGNIVPTLIDTIPGKDSQLQAEAIGLFPDLLQHDPQDTFEVVDCCDASDFLPWIHQLFELMLKALLKKDHLNVQDAASDTLSALLESGQLREVFLGLNHLDVLFSMVELEDGGGQAAVLRILDNILIYADARAALLQHHPCQKMTRPLLRATPHVRRQIFNYFVHCLEYDELKYLLVDQGLETSLLELFKLQNITSDFAEEVFSVLFLISNTPDTCLNLLSTDLIYHLLKTITSELYGVVSKKFASQILSNILNCKLNTSIFMDAIRDMDVSKPSVPTSIVDTILRSLDSYQPGQADLLISLDLLAQCLPYVDLVQALQKSQPVNKLLDILSLGTPQVKIKVLDVLFDFVQLESLRPGILTTRLMDDLMHAILVDRDDVAHASFQLLKCCLQTAPDAIEILPHTTPKIICRLLGTNRRHSIVTGLTLILEIFNRANAVKTPEQDPYLNLVTTHVMNQALHVFGSTTDETAQGLSVDIVYCLMKNDYFRRKLFTPIFFDSVCEATLSEQETYRQSALYILMSLLDDNESFILFSKRSNVVCLFDLLQRAELQSQWLVLRILAKLARFENTRTSLISYQVYDKIWDIVSVKNQGSTQTEIVVLETLQRFFCYAELRAALDCPSFVQVIVHLMLLDSKDMLLRETAFDTFQVLMTHDDMHEQMTSPGVIRAIGGTLYASWPLVYNPGLSGTQQQCLQEMLLMIENIDKDACHIVMAGEEDTTLVSPGIEIPPSPLELQRSASMESDGIGLHTLMMKEQGPYYYDDDGEGIKQGENGGEDAWKDDDLDCIIIPYKKSSMPTATRQATPGPGPSTTAKSNAKSLKRSHTAASSNAQAQGTESSKENAPDGRESKKMRLDAGNANSTVAASATTNGRSNARSDSVVSSAAENGQNGERSARSKTKRRRKKKRTPVVAQASASSLVEMVVAPLSQQQSVNHSQSQSRTAGTSDGQPQSKAREKKKKKVKEEEAVKEEEIVDTDGDVVMEQSKEQPEVDDEGRKDSKPENESPPPPQPDGNNGDDNNDDDDDDEDDDDTPRISSSAKGKGKARMDTPADESPANATSTSAVNNLDTASELARLREELARQTSLVNRHQNHLNQSQQSLTCQICLDLLHRPYALSPCGHVTCYPCLVRWFTAPRNPNANQAGPSNEAENEQNVDHILDTPAARRGAYVKRSKTCPLCRSVVSERPVEMWTIKSMVASLVRSGLGDLPVPPPAQPEAGPSNSTTGPSGGQRDTDPWRNIFRRVHPRTGSGRGGDFIDFFHDFQRDHPRIQLHDIFGHNAAAAIMGHGNGNGNANGGAAANGAGNAQNNADAQNPEEVGMFDQEDGIYRCIQCMHEIWNGVCTQCDHRYPAHRALMEAQERRHPRAALMAAALQGTRGRVFVHPDSEEDDIDPEDLAWGDSMSEDDHLDTDDEQERAAMELVGDDSDFDGGERRYDDLARLLADGDEEEDDFDINPDVDHLIEWHNNRWDDGHDDGPEVDEDDEDDMDDFYVDPDDEEDAGVFQHAVQQARNFGAHMRMGGPFFVGFDHMDEDEEDPHSDEDSHYGGSFIDDEASEEEAATDSGSEVEIVDVPPRHGHNHNHRARHRRNIQRRIPSESHSESDGESEIQVVGGSNRVVPPARRGRRVLVDDDDEDNEEEEEVEVVSELRGSGSAVASGSGSGRSRTTRSQTAARQEEARPAPAAAAAAAAIRRSQRTVIVSDDEEPPMTRLTRGRASGSGNAEAGPSGSSRSTRRR
ncbi:hypothetical protein CVT24_000262 [Panaeolus cyanescens]|uniref:RING-type domain-containing protein n=1 Tax=Panaeolus cyanescens TaxID=181874 RepID=A0A409YD92_9AGAR|nr:hypothetical protein CVT24_000262 [Panaeolus cyanescens]